jgi:hypothetical protein
MTQHQLDQIERDAVDKYPHFAIQQDAYKQGRIDQAEASGWIRVEDRLPVTDGIVRVICHKQNGLIVQLHYDGTQFKYWSNHEWLDQTTQVTHWQPLPTPPTDKI